MKVVITQIIADSDEEIDLIPHRLHISGLRLHLYLIPSFPLLKMKQPKLQCLRVKIIHKRLRIACFPLLQRGFQHINKLKMTRQTVPDRLQRKKLQRFAVELEIDGEHLSD